MTESEARIIAAIARTADGGCVCCVGSIADALAYEFPEFPWLKWCNIEPREKYPGETYSHWKQLEKLGEPL